MSMYRSHGVLARSGSGALLAATLTISSLPLGTASLAASRTTNFSGELDSAAFRKAAARNETVVIRQSPGGTGASALALARVRNVVIDGVCNSACAWSFVSNGGACFTPRASFGFHAAHDPGTGLRMNAATIYWLRAVRPGLRGRLQPLLNSSSLIRLSAADMRHYYGDRTCGTKKGAVDASSPRLRGAEALASREQKP